jgi:hypothetical protein
MRCAEALDLRAAPARSGPADPGVRLIHGAFDAIKEIACKIGAEVGELPADGHGVLVGFVRAADRHEDQCAQ